ncbi:DUF418 domain-containing protein [Saccharicrinis aurantiacus]|uniref:DUF418 domain-containing protein n=1 Tax=Saccharicrinis aurantiacus TaxID=1849719 RepID=UPI00095015DD|nr:DUF418 domain-containing protein [Saccharicrinis aurantiacus]
MTVKKPRVEVVDSLRGLAIFAIMLLHCIEHFNFYVFPDNATQPDWLNTLDTNVWDGLFFMFAGKGYAIFSLLFGFTFSLMMTKQRSLGKDFGYRFLWRLLLLVGFALINGAFFPGEVLLMYALVGLVLFFVRNLKLQALLVVGAILLSQPVEWFNYVYHLINPDYTINVIPSHTYWSKLKEAQLGDSFWETVKTNTLYGHKVALIWAVEVGRLVQTAGLFIVGYILGNTKRFYDTPENIKFWTKTLIISAIVFIPFYFLALNAKELFPSEAERLTLKRVVEMYRNLAFTFVLVSSFILLYKKTWFSKLVGGLKYPGRMSLTAYVMQSIVGGFIFYGYGLGIGPHVKHTVSLGIGIVLYALQFYFCKWWITKYGQGPLEKLWHKLTWIK